MPALPLVTLHIYILFFRKCCARCLNVVSFSHVLQIVFILHGSGLNIFIALYIVYNAWTFAFISSFLILDFRVALILLLLPILIFFIQCVSNYVPGKPKVSRVYNFADILYQPFVQNAIIYYYYYYYHHHHHHHHHQFKFLKASHL